ncbi:uncharacterized protein FOMMEDRAFT_161591 [Fomitiporia mediterranea MF3/22]|uniref:uncharacterized protein n=1 Tax=Fomitiporia mediterranea (strain MF3/22) TaxID=694068 RepID=UPI0004408318|nr:uncharacterized protein FOMMEDRAFT_161591 [Fomitiporia mediterranea MF3/22]EJC98758.1 hypothetical protein FOMMEDRAFT_161591 [Fomitiporia mediterranea MF3/22]
MSTPKDHVKKAVEANLSPDLSHKPAGSPAQRTFAQSWLAIPRRQRLVLSCILFGTALAGLYISDKLEEKVPAQGDSVKKPGPKS